MALSIARTDDQLWSDYFDSDKRPSHLADLSYAYHKELSPLAQRIHPAYMKENTLIRLGVPVRNQLDFYFLDKYRFYKYERIVVEQYQWKARCITMHPVSWYRCSGEYQFLPTTGQVLFQAPDEVKNSQDSFCYTIRNINRTWLTSYETGFGERACAYDGAVADWYKI